MKPTIRDNTKGSQYGTRKDKKKKKMIWKKKG